VHQQHLPNRKGTEAEARPLTYFTLECKTHVDYEKGNHWFCGVGVDNCSVGVDNLPACYSCIKLCWHLSSHWSYLSDVYNLASWRACLFFYSVCGLIGISSGTALASVFHLCFLQIFLFCSLQSYLVSLLCIMSANYAFLPKKHVSFTGSAPGMNRVEREDNLASI